MDEAIGVITGTLIANTFILIYVGGILIDIKNELKLLIKKGNENHEEN